MAANCSCNTDILENKDLNNIKEDKSELFNFDYLKQSFISNLFDFNYQVIYCYNLVFNLKILRKNIGFYAMIIMLLLQIIFWIIYMIKGLDNVRQYIFNLYDKNEKNNIIDPIKNSNKVKKKRKKKFKKENNKEINDDSNIKKLNNSSRLKDININYIEQQRNIINKNIIETKSTQNQILIINNDENKKIIMINNINNINYEKEISDIKSDERFNLKDKNKTYKKIFIKNKKNKFKNSLFKKNVQKNKKQKLETTVEKNENINEYQSKNIFIKK